MIEDFAPLPCLLPAVDLRPLRGFSGNGWSVSPDAGSYLNFFDACANGQAGGLAVGGGAAPYEDTTRPLLCDGRSGMYTSRAWTTSASAGNYRSLTSCLRYYVDMRARAYLDGDQVCIEMPREFSIASLQHTLYVPTTSRGETLATCCSDGLWRYWPRDSTGAPITVPRHVQKLSTTEQAATWKGTIKWYSGATQTSANLANWASADRWWGYFQTMRATATSTAPTMPFGPASWIRRPDSIATYANRAFFITSGATTFSKHMPAVLADALGLAGAAQGTETSGAGADRLAARIVGLWPVRPLAGRPEVDTSSEVSSVQTLSGRTYSTRYGERRAWRTTLYIGGSLDMAHHTGAAINAYTFGLTGTSEALQALRLPPADTQLAELWHSLSLAGNRATLRLDRECVGRFRRPTWAAYAGVPNEIHGVVDDATVTLAGESGLDRLYQVDLTLVEVLS